MGELWCVWSVMRREQNIREDVDPDTGYKVTALVFVDRGQQVLVPSVKTALQYALRARRPARMCISACVHGHICVRVIRKSAR